MKIRKAWALGTRVQKGRSLHDAKTNLATSSNAFGSHFVAMATGE